MNLKRKSISSKIKTKNYENTTGAFFLIYHSNDKLKNQPVHHLKS